jgi:hypothetical protein
MPKTTTPSVGEAKDLLIKVLSSLGMAVPFCLGPGYESSTDLEKQEALQDVARQIRDKEVVLLSLWQTWHTLVLVITEEWDDSPDDDPDGGERQVA